MKNRTYLGIYDTGHDFVEFEYSSTHKKGSKANLQDAISHLRRHLGRKHACIDRIRYTELIKQY